MFIYIFYARYKTITSSIYKLSISDFWPLINNLVMKTTLSMNVILTLQNIYLNF